MTYNNGFLCRRKAWRRGDICLVNNGCQHLNIDGEVITRFWKMPWDGLDVGPQSSSCERYTTIVCFLDVISKASISSEKQCPVDLLDNPNVQEINYWLSRFVTVVGKRDGQPYPPRTIQQILGGLVKLAGRA